MGKKHDKKVDDLMNDPAAKQVLGVLEQVFPRLMGLAMQSARDVLKKNPELLRPGKVKVKKTKKKKSKKSRK